MEIIRSQPCPDYTEEIDPSLQNIDGSEYTIITNEFDYDSLIQLTAASAKELRQKLYIDQQGICPLLGIQIPEEDAALDHKHKRKSDPVGPNGDGLVRGMLSFRSNSLEGKITNAWKRQFGYDESKHPITLPNFLRNLANYLENPPCEQIYVHPTEKIKRPKLPTSMFNLVKRYWKEVYPKRALPKFPKSGKLTEDFKLYIEQFKEFDNKVKDGTYKLLGKRDRDKIAKYYLANPKIKKTDRPHLGKYITEPILGLLNTINTSSN
jgi:hypothetical protein